MTNPLVELQKQGQSFWYDNIRRGLIQSGELKKMIDNDGLRGVTSNPTIFEKAIGSSTDYDDAIRELVAQKKSVGEIFDAISIKDIQMACDLFAPLYKETKGEDGYVSIEVSPAFARDTEKTVEEARRLWKLVHRPNVMVKIPATKEGVPAIERALGEGININVTLIFSNERYEQVINAYFAALEKLARDGKPLNVASVASFFVSRIDTSVDKILQDRLQSSTSAREKDALLELMGKVAIANAKMAYQLYKEKFSSPIFTAFKKKGARVQRPLWASTGTKNPNYSDVLYVEELIGPDTVDTMPPATISAFRDHGKVRASLDENVTASRDTLDRLKAQGIDLKKITQQLENEGVKTFADSYDKLMQVLSAKREMIQAAENPDRQTLSLGKQEAAVRKEVERLNKNKAAERLWARDASLWKSDEAVQGTIRNRLGWLELPAIMSEHAASLTNFAADIKKAGFTHVVLIGMGGSSLAPEVLRLSFPGKKDGLPLFVLDTTDPGQILSVEKEIEIGTTLFLVSSKSGGTIEVLSLFRYFYAKVQAVKKAKAGGLGTGGARGADAKAGENFVAITDPSTSLEKLAHEKHFRKVFTSPADVGGRFSALTYFGLVPAALLGIDVKTLLDRAERISSACASCVPATDNPGVKLGAALGTLGLAGADKVTFFASPEISSFGTWVEQLIAESTGKEGKGLVPVDGEEPAAPEAYGKDRVFVFLKLATSKDTSIEPKVKALEAAGFPVIQILLNDVFDLAQEFLRWEIATAVAGVVMGINPFDEPNVTESKTNTGRVLEQFNAAGKLPEETPLLKDGAYTLWADAVTTRAVGRSPAALVAGAVAGKTAGEILAAHLGRAKAGDYVAFLAYVTPSAANHKALQKLRHRARDVQRVATTLGYGPRFLHSTGQLHKGGAENGLFVEITMEDEKDPPVPETAYGFSTLKNAQALGDYQSLKDHSRRVLHVRVSGQAAKDLDKLAAAIEKVKTSA